MSYICTTSKIRTPIKGLRQKVRTALRAAGLEGKFQTDILRDGKIVVVSDKDMVLPLKEFDGREIVFWKRWTPNKY